MSSTQARRVGGTAALVAGGVLAGGILAGTLSASADDTATSPSTPPPAAPSTEGQPDNPNPGDPGRPQRSDEELLTGSTAQRVEDAVLAKYPGATFVRVETDSDGVYEAHITKADGAPLTVELDTSFTITGEEQMGGPGHGPDGDGPGTGTDGTAGGSGSA